MDRPRQISTISGLMVLTAAVALYIAWLSHVNDPWFLASFLAVAGAARPTLAVFRLRRDFWHPADLAFVTFDPDAPDADRFVRRNIENAAADLGALGFGIRGHFRLAPPTAAGFVFGSLFENPATGEAASLATSLSEAGATVRLGFITRLADSAELTTWDSAGPLLSPRPRGHLGMAFPDVTSAAMLYRIHQARVAAHGGSTTRYLPDSNEMMLPFLRGRMKRECSNAVALGHYRLDEACRVYRLTWKGACSLAWKVFWPARPLWEAAIRRRAKRALRVLGVGPDHPTPSAE